MFASTNFTCQPECSSLFGLQSWLVRAYHKVWKVWLPISWLWTTRWLPPNAIRTRWLRHSPNPKTRGRPNQRLGASQSASKLLHQGLQSQRRLVRASPTTPSAGTAVGSRGAPSRTGRQRSIGTIGLHPESFGISRLRRSRLVHHIGSDGLAPALRHRVLGVAGFQNPEFYKAQAIRLPTYDSLADDIDVNYRPMSLTAASLSA
jgi:hypothetical protein